MPYSTDLQSRSKILSILGYTKLIKSDKLWRFEKLHCSLLRIYKFVNFAQPRIQLISHCFFWHIGKINHRLDIFNL